MSKNEVPRDKKGKPLKAGQWVRVQTSKSPPVYTEGRIMFVGWEKTYVLPYERRGDDFPNKDIEVKIDV